MIHFLPDEVKLERTQIQDPSGLEAIVSLEMCAPAPFLRFRSAKNKFNLFQLFLNFSYYVLLNG